MWIKFIFFIVTKSMNITEKITKDINQFKTAPKTFETPEPNSGWNMDIIGINTSYVIAIVFGIIAIFGAWFAWDWYKDQRIVDNSKVSSSSVTSSVTEKESSSVEKVSNESSNIPPVVTTMSPLQYAKFKNDQLALENALDPQPTSKPQDYVVEDSTTSAIQQSKLSSKAGWCYIGEDRGYGSCLKVDENQFCMSGHVYDNESACRQLPK
jgi:hypothetical protein